MTDRINLPESLKKSVSGDAPLNIRLMLARSQLPLSVADKLGVLRALENDPQREVRDSVEESWRAFDTLELLKALQRKDFDGSLLDVAAEKFPGSADIAITIISHPNVEPETLRRYVDTDDTRVLSFLGENQRVLLKDHGIVRELLKNPLLDLSVAGRLASLIGLEDLGREEPQEPAPEEAAPVPEEEIGPKGEPGDAFDYGVEIPDEFSTEIPEELLNENAPDLFGPDEGHRDGTNIYQLIQNMSIAEKIKLATLGSKNARKLLARDPNRVVVTAVVRSPKIREDEIVPIAQDRMTPDDVLNYIMTRKEWMKNYQIRLAVVKNPKTPLPKALRLLETLNMNDLRSLSKNRNIPQAVASASVRIVSRRSH